MITFDAAGVRFADAEQPVLRDVGLTIPEGELALVVGRTGSGKTTLLRAINGLVPHFSGGTLTGRVLVDGRDTREHRPHPLPARPLGTARVDRRRLRRARRGGDVR